ncbi:hypothetical protein [Citrobacter freundii]|uniref:hypothetical protein n=1 Tax=Citrobacter freundii TaxID=546 RepID=UPI00174D3D77|nr:hypothetical protein [Citrobacter freundii]EAT2029982.1 hypothetical protein [Salmonella enterica]MBD5662150.1 hypothetical protein [Citrobacter freundii]
MKQILTTAEHNQARANVLTLRSLIDSYASTHSKKHGWTTLLALFLPGAMILLVGYSFMTDISPLVGAAFTLIASIFVYGLYLGPAGYLAGNWKNDEIAISDLQKIREFSPFVKEIVSKAMERNGGSLTYTVLEDLLKEAEVALKQDELRFNISKQLDAGV